LHRAEAAAAGSQPASTAPVQRRTIVISPPGRRRECRG
jgi:hypothetical protein